MKQFTNILLDMDGVVADFTSEAIARCNLALRRDHTIHEYATTFGRFEIAKFYGISKGQFWSIVDAPGLFENLQPFPWALELFDWLNGIASVTFSTTPSLNPDSARQKAVWLQRHLALNNTNLMVGGRKHLMARPNTLLVDDYALNVLSFSAAGGAAVLVPSNWNTPDLTYEKVTSAIESALQAP